MSRRLLPLAVAGLLAGCTADHKWATDAEVAAAHYTAPPPATITLISSINNRSGEGAHSALLISGSQRVLYDPAGSWDLPKPWTPERNDLRYGMTEGALQSFLTYQSGANYRVVMQSVTVPVEVADAVMASAIEEGSAGKAFCANSITKVLNRVPGFEGVGTTMFPKQLAREFAELPGVTEKIYEETTGRGRTIPVQPGTGILRETWDQVSG